MANYNQSNCLPVVIGGGQVTGGTDVTFTVPDGATWIVQDISAMDTTLNLDVVIFEHIILGFDSGVIAALMCTGLNADEPIGWKGAFIYQHWVGFHAMNAGDVLRVRCGSGETATYSISGLELLDGYGEEAMTIQGTITTLVDETPLVVHNVDL